MIARRCFLDRFFIFLNSLLFFFYFPGRKFDLEPTESKWYIIYFSNTFELKIEPGTNMVTGISLMGKNVCDPKYSAQHVQIAGIQFTVFRGRFSKITGAEIGFL